LDTDQLLGEALQVHETPQLIVLQREKVIFRRAGCNWLEDTELEIQTFLRSTDPGLALLPLFKPEFSWLKDQGNYKLGREKGISFPAPGFKPPEKGFATGTFSTKRSDLDNLPSEDFWISGIWLQDAERIATSDPHATLGFNCPTKRFGLIAQNLSPTRVPTKIVIEIKGLPVVDRFEGQDLKYDDEGQSVIRLESPQLYEALKNLSEKDCQISLKFPTANRAPIALYEILFCE
jgi:hypothetical protein